MCGFPQYFDLSIWPKRNTKLLSKMVLLVYAIPMLSYVVFGGGFSGKSVYGLQEEMVFVSNHFGWSAALFLLATFHLDLGRKTYQKLVLRIFMLLAIYLLVVSGNRASLLAVALAFIVILFYYKGVPIYTKFFILIAPVILSSLF